MEKVDLIDEGDILNAKIKELENKERKMEKKLISKSAIQINNQKVEKELNDRLFSTLKMSRNNNNKLILPYVPNLSVYEYTNAAN